MRPKKILEQPKYLKFKLLIDWSWLYKGAIIWFRKGLSEYPNYVNYTCKSSRPAYVKYTLVEGERSFCFYENYCFVLDPNPGRYYAPGMETKGEDINTLVSLCCLKKTSYSRCYSFARHQAPASPTKFGKRQRHGASSHDRAAKPTIKKYSRLETLDQIRKEIFLYAL